MSHSTTATSTYPLAKYSKSYLQPTSDSTPEWQHFTNPSIRLVLDIKKAAQLESVRLRILWAMDSDNDSEQREVVFEDIDLLTLSCLPQPPTQKQQAQGLPLKAVYRDSVVGIRYLHPIEYKDVPVYRRFQITFFSSVSVLEFIKAISTICPCKANPTGNTAPRPMHPPPVPHQYQTSLSYAPSMASSQLNHSVTVSKTKQPQGYRVPLSSSPSLAFSSNIPAISPLVVDPSEAQMPTSSLAGSLPLGHASSTPSASLSNQNPQISTDSGLQQQISLPSSSPLTSSAKSGIDNFEESSKLSDVIGATTTSPPSALLASLRESTHLYDLPRAKLERLVGDVVREKGFAKLASHFTLSLLRVLSDAHVQMEDLNSMWAVKSFVGV